MGPRTSCSKGRLKCEFGSLFEAYSRRMIQTAMIIRAALLCTLVAVAACKPAPKLAPAPTIPATHVLEPLSPARPLAEFVRRALEIHCSNAANAGFDDERFWDREIMVELIRIKPSDFPDRVRNTKFRVASRDEIESALRNSSAVALDYLGVRNGSATPEGYRTLVVGLGYVEKVKDGKMEHGGSCGCTYVETRSKDGYVIVQTNAWIQ